MIQLVQEGLEAAERAHLRGDFVNAARIYTSILEVTPQHPRALHQFGVLCHQLGKHEDARVLISRAVAVLAAEPRRSDRDSSSDLAECRLNLASVLLALDLPERALAQCDAVAGQADASSAGLAGRPAGVASIADPTARFLNEVYYLRRSRTLRQLNRNSAALACLAVARHRFPQSEPLALAMADTLTELGRTSDAMRAYRVALRINPDSSAALFNYSRLQLDYGRSLSTDVCRRLEKLAAGTSTTDRLRGLFSLAAAAEARAEYGTAFARYQEANAVRRSQLREKGHPLWSGEELPPYFSAIRRTCEAAAISRWRRFGSSSQRPVFIVGLPRSGSTLVEQILASHPQVESIGERSDIERLLRHRLRSRGIPNGFPEAIDELTADDWQACASQYEQQMAAAHPDATRVINKLPGNVLHAGFIAAMFPEARIICCTRDHRDTIWSCFTQNFRSDSLAAIFSDLAVGWHYAVEVEQLASHWRSVLPGGNWLELSYEELVCEPRREITRLLQFLELPWSDECLLFHRQERVVRTASANQVRQPLHTRSIGRWRNYACFLSKWLPE